MVDRSLAAMLGNIVAARRLPPDKQIVQFGVIIQDRR